MVDEIRSSEANTHNSSITSRSSSKRLIIKYVEPQRVTTSSTGRFFARFSSKVKTLGDRSFATT